MNGLLLLLSLWSFLSFVHGQGLTGWTYEVTDSTCLGTPSSPCGPAYWNQVSGASACSGVEQSPVNIAQASVNYTLSPPTYLPQTGGCEEWLQFSNNYTFEVAFVEGSNFLCNNQLTYEGKTYSLMQMHVHSPSEHTFGGGFYSAEIHLVHQIPSTKETLVLGIMLQENSFNIQTSNNSFFQALWSHGGPSGGLIHANETNLGTLQPYETLLPSRQSYYSYQGSFTAPPCREGVHWLVFDQPVTISQSDLQLLRNAIGYLPTNDLSAYGNNNRLPQPALNSRTVQYSPGPAQSCVMQMSTTNDDNNTAMLAKSQAVAALIVGLAALIFSVITFVLALSISSRMGNIQASKKNEPSAAVELSAVNPMSHDDGKMPTSQV